MLTEEEWREVGPLLSLDTERTQQIRKEKEIGLKDVLAELQSQACQKFEELTGYKETNWNAIWHHRLSQYGPECSSCGHLFRSPKASFCANCGQKTEAEPVRPANAATRRG